MTLRRCVVALVAPAAVAQLSCATMPLVAQRGAAQPPSDAEDIAEPRERDPAIGLDFLHYSVGRPLRRLLNPLSGARVLVGAKTEAFDVTAEDDVAPSTWFEHRIGPGRLTPEDVRRGPGPGSGPDTAGVWTVVRPKTQGGTPGFDIVDARGDRYVIKFDHPAFPEMASAADAIGSRLFFAAGYHVPQNDVAILDPARLRIRPGVQLTDLMGRRRPMTDADLEELLGRVARLSDGRIRVLASRYLPGRPKGPFAFEGRRRDDPNDHYLHQHRRELRGLYVLVAWLNHTDFKQQNTLDMFVTDGDRHFLRHHLLDFGATLGSFTDRPHTPRDGQEFHLDLAMMAARMLTGGAYAASWERLSAPAVIPAVGYYSDRDFDPGGWKTAVPHPAFARRTTRDGYWGAKLVAAFSEAHLRAAVEAGRFTDPAAAASVLATLLARRAATLGYWFSRVTPLESLAVETSAESLLVRFSDLAVAHGVHAAAARRYAYALSLPLARHRSRGVATSVLGADGRFELTLPLPPRERIAAVAASAPPAARLGTLDLAALPQPGGPRPRPLRLHLLWDAAAGAYRLVGRRY